MLIFLISFLFFLWRRITIHLIIIKKRIEIEKTLEIAIKIIALL